MSQDRRGSPIRNGWVLHVQRMKVKCVVLRRSLSDDWERQNDVYYGKIYRESEGISHGNGTEGNNVLLVFFLSLRLVIVP